MHNYRQDLDQRFTFACRCLKIYFSDEYNSQFLDENKNSSVQTKDLSYYWNLLAAIFNMYWITEQLV